MTINQQPDALSLSLNIKDFKIASTDSVPFVLKKGTTELVAQNYEPGQDGFVTISVRDMVHAQLSFALPPNTSPYEQPNIAANFTAVVDGTEVTFRVLRAGVDKLADTAANFLTANWLTWQPQTKAVTYSSPEYLSYYAVATSVAKLKAYFTNEAGEVTSEQTITLHNLTAGKAYTLTTQYAAVSALLSNALPAFYDVWVEDGSGTRLTYVQRYYAGNMQSEQEDWVLFENSLGGIDCFRAYGATNFTGEHTHNLAEIDEVSQEYRVDTERKYDKNTGYLDKEQRRWLLDFFPSLTKYIYTAQALRSIVVTESNVTYTDKELPSNFSFTYKYADATALLNIARTATPTEVLTISVPDLGNFTVPPRLVEVARLPLTEGALFPIQSPYSEEWATTTAGAIFNFVKNLLGSSYEGGGGIGHTHGNLEVLQALSYAAGYLRYDGAKLKAGYADDIPEVIQKVITFAQGLKTQAKSTFEADVEFGDFSDGILGTGGKMKIDAITGIVTLIIDNLDVRKRATFVSLLIEELAHIGGEFIVSPARMKCNKVEEMATAYRCYFDRGEPDTNGFYPVNNQFTVGALARCQVFVGNGQKYYWRRVDAIGENYIDLSKIIADTGSGIPSAGDNICQLGHDSNADLQSAIVLSSYGDDAPSYKQYNGINSFSLLNKAFVIISRDGNVFSGQMHIQPGSTGWNNIEGLTDKFESLITGAVNLLLNTGFTGDYKSIELSANTPIDNSTQLYSQQTKHWTVSGVTIQEDLVSKSGYAAVIGLLAQSVELTEGENYILSFKAKGTSLTAVCGSLNETIAVTTEYQRFVLKFTASQATSVVFNGVATICEIMLERGTIASEWRASYLDNDKSFAEFKAYQYIISAMKNASSDTIGGLFLTNMLMVGNYKDGVMQKVTGGKSGIYNSDDDVSDWGGGTYEQAVYTAMKYLQNPGLEATEEELALMCKWLATHGGRFILNDAIVRGVIYANGGVFRGGVYAQYGEFAGFIKTSYQTWPAGETVVDLSKGAHWIVRPQSAGLTLYLPPASPANEGTDVRLFNSFILTRSSYEFVLRIQDNETLYYPKFEPIIDTHYKAVIVNSQEIILRSISNQWYIVNYNDFVSTDFLTE